MRPCVGVPDVCPPLCSYVDIKSGLISLYEIEMFNQTIEELCNAKAAAMRAQNG